MTIARLESPLDGFSDPAFEPEDAFPATLASALQKLHVHAGGDAKGAATIGQVAHAAAAAILQGRTFVETSTLAQDGAHKELERVLSKSPVVSKAGDAPLVWSEGRIYLARYWKYEHDFLDKLGALNRPVAGMDEGRLEKLLAEHFPDGGPAKPNWQKVAAATAVLRHLCVISGGPGTGKTSTVVKILAILLTLKPDLKVAIAAPTGKAAARVQESIRLQMAAMKLPDKVAQAMPRDPHTLHRLLRWKPGEVGFRHNADNPLPYDVVVVDEASMLDLALAAKLVGALRNDARLILLGDKDQLSSVEAGAVYSGVSSRRTLSKAWAKRIAGIARESLPAVESDEHLLRDGVTWLEHSYRFSATSALGQLAAAINAADPARVAAILAANDPAVAWNDKMPAPKALAEVLAHGYADYVAAAKAGGGAKDVFAAFDAYRVLCSTRAGQYGSTRLGQQLLESVRRSLGTPTGQQWFTGRAVLVTSNDYSLRLFNGDVGIALPDAAGRLLVHFQAADGSVRTVSPMQLGNVEDALAITVHRAQGSEFQRVAFVIEPELVRGLSKALVYTAVTRASKALQVWSAGIPQLPA